MNLFFNVKIEFDKKIVDSIIEDTIIQKEKGYVCVIESNNLTVANKDKSFLETVNGSLVNICDGSVLARMLGLIHGHKFRPYLGDDLLNKYVGLRKYRHFFLGNTKEVLEGLKRNFSRIDPLISDMHFEALPFCKVEEFDYTGIAELIKNDNPDIIWVSLGAPKQELFMRNLLQYINRGVMAGVGAAFNFNAGVGPVKRAPKIMRRLAMEWIYRAYQEPKKNIPRYIGFLRILPRLLFEEIKKKTQGKKNERL